VRYTQAEKLEVIRLVEGSDLPAKRTLAQLGVSKSTFYEWYRRYLDEGPNGLALRPSQRRRFWNRIPDAERERVVERSVYRILRSYDLLTSPAYIVMTAADEFKHKTKRVHELWQTDFTYFKIVGWGWYYLSTVLDDFSRYIISWRLTTNMAAEDVTMTLDDALAKTGVEQVKVVHRPRLLSDNGPCYISKELAEYLDKKDMAHTRGAPYHPQTQGKIERYHRTMKNVVKLRNYYYPDELRRELDRFVKYYNNERVHESLKNVTPADVYHGRHHVV